MAVQQWTTTGFELTPAGDASPAEGDDRIRELKETAGSLLDKEHLARDAGSTAAQGWHREGSAIAYYESAAPTNRPDGVTALDSNDAGRLWIDSDDGTPDYWDGSAWQDLISDQSLLTTDDVVFNSVTADLTGGVTGNLTGGIVEVGSGAGVMKMKVVNIGDWNMDSAANVNVAHGLGASWANVRSIQCLIRNDGNTEICDLLKPLTDGSALSGSVYLLDSTYVQLNRKASGLFDSTDYNSTSYNRGWLTIWYVA